jgi:hypothetical protein
VINKLAPPDKKPARLDISGEWHHVPEKEKPDAELRRASLLGSGGWNGFLFLLQSRNRTKTGIGMFPDGP